MPGSEDRSLAQRIGEDRRVVTDLEFDDLAIMGQRLPHERFSDHRPAFAARKKPGRSCPWKAWRTGEGRIQKTDTASL